MGFWRQLLDHGSGFDLDVERWIVLDVETSGLNPKRDRLLSIAALGLRVPADSGSPKIDFSDSFEVALGQAQDRSIPAAAERDNILIHGIGLGAQASGQDPAQALAAFCEFVGRSPLIAFHSAFDQTLIERYMVQFLGSRLPNPWIDLEHVAAVLYKQPRRLALDDWLRRFDVRCAARHQAVADTLATSELLLKLWPRLKERATANWDGFSRTASEVDFLAGRAKY